MAWAAAADAAVPRAEQIKTTAAAQKNSEKFCPVF